MYTVTLACINQLATYIVFVASNFSKLKMHTICMKGAAHCMHARLKGKQKVADDVNLSVVILRFI